MPEINARERSKDGFKGTIPDFLNWIACRLTYGHVHVSEPFRTDGVMSKTVRRVEMVTAGYSDDEVLLSRVRLGRGSALSLFGMKFWESTHRGGLYVYEVPLVAYDSEKEKTWLQPAADQFENVARARTLVIRTQDGDDFAIETPGGVALSFSETERDINRPSGVLTVEPYEGWLS